MGAAPASFFVGESTLFILLIGKKKSCIGDLAGVIPARLHF